MNTETELTDEIVRVEKEISELTAMAMNSKLRDESILADRAVNHAQYYGRSGRLLLRVTLSEFERLKKDAQNKRDALNDYIKNLSSLEKELTELKERNEKLKMGEYIEIGSFGDLNDENVIDDPNGAGKFPPTEGGSRRTRNHMKHTNRSYKHNKRNKHVVRSRSNISIRRRKHTSSLMYKRHKRSMNRTRYGGSISKKKYKPTHTKKRKYNKSRTYKY